MAVIFSLGVHAQKPKITLLTWEQAIVKNKKNPKMIFVDVYTDWCGWCKVMDSKTFSDSAVAVYMSKHFYCVKFNAKQQAELKFNNLTYKYKTDHKVHEFAIWLLNSSMMYPSFAILNKKCERVTTIKGYYEVKPFLEKLETVVKDTTKN
jgi:thioredoxin-related protein